MHLFTVNANKLVVMVNVMLKRAISYTFYVLIYLSGIVIGGVYTPEVIAYVEQMDEHKNVQQHEMKKPPQLKKKRQRSVSLG